MRKEIIKFYNRTKLGKEFEEEATEPTEVPITHVKVFHKEYPRLPKITLAGINSNPSGLKKLLDSRESYRDFSDEPISYGEISRILLSCKIVDNNREPERRTYPSGGARFPVELYLLTNNVEGLEKGAYHYSIKNKELELLVKQDWGGFEEEIVSPYIDNPGASIIFTAVISRSEVKYGLRAYPYSLIEAGHMGQNIQLAASEMGIGSCPVSGFVDDTVKRILDLSENEIPIYSISLGKKK